jgi:KDO2-lipid IV(A) lauroyltransferase
MKTLIKRTMIYFMWYPLRITIKRLPLRIIYMIGTAGGYLLYHISKDKKRTMAEELKIIMPGNKRSAIMEIIRSSFINYCVSEIEVLLYPFLSKDLIKKMVTLEGKEHLDDALSRGKGVLLFQAHFGAFQMVMPAIGYNGYKMNQISASASIWKESTTSAIQKKTFDIKAKYEYTLPVRHIPVESTLRPVFRLLKKNEIVGITVDGGGGRNVTSIRFLGRDANFQQGAADLALRTGAAVVPAFIITERALRHRLIID